MRRVTGGQALVEPLVDAPLFEWCERFRNGVAKHFSGGSESPFQRELDAKLVGVTSWADIMDIESKYRAEVLSVMDD